MLTFPDAPIYRRENPALAAWNHQPGGFDGSVELAATNYLMSGFVPHLAGVAEASSFYKQYQADAGGNLIAGFAHYKVETVEFSRDEDYEVSGDLDTQVTATSIKSFDPDGVVVTNVNTVDGGNFGFPVAPWPPINNPDTDVFNQVTGTRTQAKTVTTTREDGDGNTYTTTLSSNWTETITPTVREVTYYATTTTDDPANQDSTIQASYKRTLSNQVTHTDLINGSIAALNGENADFNANGFGDAPLQPGYAAGVSDFGDGTPNRATSIDILPPEWTGQDAIKMNRGVYWLTGAEYDWDSWPDTPLNFFDVSETIRNDELDFTGGKALVHVETVPDFPSVLYAGGGTVQLTEEQILENGLARPYENKSSGGGQMYVTPTDALNDSWEVGLFEPNHTGASDSIEVEYHRMRVFNRSPKRLRVTYSVNSVDQPPLEVLPWLISAERNHDSDEPIGPYLTKLEEWDGAAWITYREFLNPADAGYAEAPTGAYDMIDIQVISRMLGKAGGDGHAREIRRKQWDISSSASEGQGVNPSGFVRIDEVSEWSSEGAADPFPSAFSNTRRYWSVTFDCGGVSGFTPKCFIWPGELSPNFDNSNELSLLGNSDYHTGQPDGENGVSHDFHDVSNSTVRLAAEQGKVKFVHGSILTGVIPPA